MIDFEKLEELTANARQKGCSEYMIRRMRNAFFRKHMDAIEGQRMYLDIGEKMESNMISTGDYAVLGLPNNSDKEKVNQAFRELSKIFHPDNQQTGNEGRMKEISLAKRNIYESRGWTPKL